MAKLALNKSTLHRESRKLKTYRQYVPALDLKRKQILRARVAAKKELRQIEQHRCRLAQEVGEQLPMLAETAVDLTQLVKISQLEIGHYNLVGIDLPELTELQLEVAQYSRLSMPHWVDRLVLLLQDSLRLSIEYELLQRRTGLLEQALQKTTQRLNLFDKVLIPRTVQHIRKICIALSDSERAGVVQAKFAKNKRKRLALS